MRTVFCESCKIDSELVTGKEIYPHREDLYSLYFYRCPKCERRVGCHYGTTNPLGGLASAQERVWRMRAHQRFDKLWKGGTVSRKQAYAWLSRVMGLPTRKTHIGMFTVSQCKNVIEFCDWFKAEDLL
jgi:hypothetical protein